MGFFVKDRTAKRGGKPPSVTEQRQRRLSRVATTDLPSWAEQATHEIGRALTALSRDDASVELLDDALLAAETLVAIILEMQKRR